MAKAKSSGIPARINSKVKGAEQGFKAKISIGKEAKPIKGSTGLNKLSMTGGNTDKFEGALKPLKKI